MSRLLLGFNVNERPRPKGSLTVRPNGSVVEAVDPEGVFRAAVCRAAWSALTGDLPSGATGYRDFRAARLRSRISPVSGTVQTSMLFRFARKPGHKLWAPGDPLAEKSRALGVGDIEKLVRNVHDALVDVGFLVDDHQVTSQGRVGKRFIDEDMFEIPGVLILVHEDEQEEALRRDEEVFGEWMMT